MILKLRLISSLNPLVSCSFTADNLSKIDFKDVEELILVYTYDYYLHQYYFSNKLLIPGFTYVGQRIEIVFDIYAMIGQVYVKTDTTILFDKVDLLTGQIETVTDSHCETVDRSLGR